LNNLNFLPIGYRRDFQKKRPKLLNFGLWRSRADLNRCTRFCRPLPNHSATGPFLLKPSEAKFEKISASNSKGCNYSHFIAKTKCGSGKNHGVFDFQAVLSADYERKRSGSAFENSCAVSELTEQICFALTGLSTTHVSNHFSGLCPDMIF
jgi:hypothetical protein